MQSGAPRRPVGAFALKSRLSEFLDFFYGEDLVGRRQVFAVVLDMVLGRFVAVTRGLLRVAVSDESLVCRVCVIFLFVMLRRLAVMPRGLLVMIRRREMVFLACEHSRHDISLIAADRAVRIGRRRPPRSGRHSLALFKWGAKSILPMKY
jgi:hypothetical protein